MKESKNNDGYEYDFDCHACDYNERGMCTICGAVRFGSSLYRDLYGGE